MGRRLWGVTLGGTLLIAMVVSVLAFGLAGATVGHLNLFTHQDNLQIARNLALSAIAQTVGELRQDPEFSGQVTFHRHQQPESTGRVRFGTEQGDSTNNVDGEESVRAPDGRAVPAYSARILAEGRHAGTVHRVEAIVTIPPFPYAIACAGEITSEGGLRVGSLAPNWRNTRPSLEADLLPSDVLCNSLADPSLNLGGDCRITGDLQSAGGISLSQGATVEGEILPFSGTRELPQIVLEEFDPASDAGVQNLDPATVYEQASFAGIVRSAGNLRLTGGANFENALLYVQGDLVVEGGITGQGAIVATGHLTIAGGVSELSAENRVAVMAGRGLTVTGDGPDNDFFRGIVYSQGPVVANGLTVVGALIVNDPDATPGESEVVTAINDTRVLADPDIAEPFAGVGGNEGSLAVTLAFTFNRVYDENWPPGATVFSFIPVGGEVISYRGSDTTIDEVITLLAPTATNDLRRMLRNNIRLNNRAGGSGPGGGGGVATEQTWLIRPSEFYSTTDGMRVVLWRDM